MSVTTLQSRFTEFAIGKQSAQGTAATAAAFAAGVSGGSVFEMEVSEDEVKATWLDRIPQGSERTAVKPSAKPQMVATPGLTGDLLFAAIGSDAVTGVGPYTHVLTQATDLPWETLFALLPDGNWWQMLDAKVSSVELSWDGPGHVQVQAEIMGCTPSVLASAPTITNTERVSGGFAVGAGGTFQINSVPINITKGSIKIDNKCQQVILANEVTPQAITPEMAEVTYSFNVLMPDYTLLRDVLFGSSVATSGVASGVYLAPISVEFASPSTDTLTVASPSCRIALPWPEAKAEGGPVELEITGHAQLPTSGQFLTATVVNSIATY